MIHCAICNAQKTTLRDLIKHWEAYHPRQLAKGLAKQIASKKRHGIL